MQKDEQIAGIILAAGGSSRMKDGQQKLLLPLGDRPVIVHVIESALASYLRPIIVVLGHRAEEIKRTIANYLSAEQGEHLRFVVNNDYTNGMSTSLGVGLWHIINHEEDQRTIMGAMVLLGDQPFMSTRTINRLIKVALEEAFPIVAPRYNGKRGNPVIFSGELFPELLHVVGDEGGKSVIERHRAEVRMVEMEEMGQNHDVDTWEAYQRALEMWQKGQGE